VYHLAAPIVVNLDQNVGQTWGVSGLGAVLIADYDTPEPVLLLDVTANVAVRFMQLHGFSLRGKTGGQHGLVLRALSNSRWFYSFKLDGITVECCDDAIRLEGSVFEGEVCWCYGRDSNCGFALGNDDVGGIISAINVWGGSYSQNKVDGIRAFGPQYREPYDFSIFGTYVGNNGRYAINAAAGFSLLKGVRMENPWCDPTTHDPDSRSARAAVNMCNFGVMEQSNTGGNGNGDTLVNGYLNGPLIMRDCSISSAAPKALRLTTLQGNGEVQALNCSGGKIETNDSIAVTQT
jgi:hypothetical protein